MDIVGLLSGIEITRPKNIAIALPTVFLGAYIVLSQQWSSIEATIVCLNALSVASFMAAGNVLNDLVDFDSDKVNHPRRPLPSERITVNSAKQIAVATTLLSFISMLFSSVVFYQDNSRLPYVSILIWTFACILMVTYELGPSTKKMGLKGNISISMMVGLVILYGGSSFSNIFYEPLLLSVAATATFANLAREILKDCQDIEGDVGRNTLPMEIGVDKARMFSYVIALGAMIFTALPYYLSWGGLNIGYLIIQTPAILLLITLNNPISKGEDKKAQKQVRFAMLAGLVGFAISIFQT